MSVKVHVVTAGLCACGTSGRVQRFWKRGLRREEVGHRVGVCPSRDGEDLRKEGRMGEGR